MAEGKLVQMVTELAIKLDKVTNQEAGSEQAMDLLKALSKIDMDAEIFRLSKVAFAVKKCKASEGVSGEVKEMATQLIKKWKKSLQAGETGAGGGVSSAASPAPLAVSREGSNSSVKSSSEMSVESTTKPPAAVSKEGAPSQATGTSGVVTVEHFNFAENKGLPAQRIKIQNLLMKSLLKFPEGQQNGTVSARDDRNAAWTAMSIEHGINEVFDFQTNSKAYSEKVRSLKSNLEVNDDLRQEVVQGNITAQQLAKMTPAEMESQEMKRSAAATRRYAAEEANPDISEYRDRVRANLGLQSEGGSFCCRRCKGVKTSHYAKQTRSSDEPMTMFITCETCGLRWRE